MAASIFLPLDRNTALRFLESSLTPILPGGYYPAQTVAMLIEQGEGPEARLAFENARRERVRHLVKNYIEHEMPEGLASPVERQRMSSYIDRWLVDWIENP